MLNVPAKSYYCVYWYPTIFHQEKEHRRIKPHPIDVSDKSSNNLYYLTIEEEKAPHKKDAYNLNYYLSREKKTLSELKSGGNCISFTFHYVRHSRNGFVVYSYDRDALVNAYWGQFTDEQATGIKQGISSLLQLQGNPAPSNYEIENYPVDRLLLNCYHHSKNFYHEHEVQEEADGKLEAYFFTLNETSGKRHYLTNEPKLSPKNHDALNWFIDQFEKQFIRYAKRVSDTYRQDEDQLKRYERIISDSETNTGKRDKSKTDRFLTLLRWEYLLNQNLEQGSFRERIDSKFREKFWKDNLEELQKVDVVTKEREIRALTKKIRDFRLRFFRTRLTVLESICNNATTEYTYCKTLLGSKYNEIYNYSSLFTDDEIGELNVDNVGSGQCDKKLMAKDRCRKKAFNIRNCMRYIEGVRQKCAIWENELTQELLYRVKNISESVEEITQSNKAILEASNKSNRISELLGWLGGALGCVGLGLALGNFNYGEMTFQYKLWVPVIFGVSLFVFGLVKVSLEKRSESRKKTV